MKKIFLTRTLDDLTLKKLKKRYQVEVHSGKIPISQTKLRSKIRGIEGLICFPYDKIDKKTIDLAENLKVISTYSVGFDHIDTEYAKKKGIKIGYTPEVLTDATADLTFALLLDLMRRVSEGDRTIRKKKWNEVYGAFDYVGFDLQGKTLGIIGLGRIGRALAKRASAFDMKINYHNRKRVSKTLEKTLGVKFASFEKIITESDIISIHVPHTKETEHMFNSNVFRKMKKTAFLINTSRGKVVNEKDLITALKKKTIAGAGLDVFEIEPIEKDSQLLRLENCLITPHIGSSTIETRKKMAEITMKNLDYGIRGEKPIYTL
ncbi:2-hydroxyacid dehydrogenase [Nitrosopumilus sp.]|uniref:2-hydroxyacid dehydrogenase n=1 Tax=Nitrosopumilus sp. TaxID=2024843 RepID=UPI003B5CC3D9